ncbi:hypothetical protein [Peribacillus muralis]|uniref:hypothetical protein n=1 Tax=Peribacillus muralis TaxID=264697 RepID=UPI00070FB681|nr:hypothetical protein [Peribacillus muralis]
MKRGADRKFEFGSSDSRKIVIKAPGRVEKLDDLLQPLSRAMKPKKAAVCKVQTAASSSYEIH